MAIDLRTGEFACSVCGKKYPTAIKADACRDSHDMLYIPMTKTEFNRLVHALAFNDFSVIPESLRITIRKYQRSSQS